MDAYVETTTACTTTGTLMVGLSYTDDHGARSDLLVPIAGTGVSGFASSTLAMSSTGNYGTGSFVLKSTGAAAIQFQTTYGTCGSGGPAVYQLFLSATQVQ